MVSLPRIQARLGMVALKSSGMKSVTLETAGRGPRKVPAGGALVRAAREMGISFAAANGADDDYTARRRSHGAP